MNEKSSSVGTGRQCFRSFYTFFWRSGCRSGGCRFPMNGNGGRESKNLTNGINKTSIMVLTGWKKKDSCKSGNNAAILV